MYIGRPLARVEDDRLLTGRGRFTDDESRAGQAWCAFVRSPHAHARVATVRIHAASRAPGVLLVLTGEDYAADGLKPVDHVPNPLDMHDITKRAFDDPKQWPQWPLARDKVRHVGEPVVAVIAETMEQARDAADLVEIDYEPLAAEEEVCFDYAFGDAGATSAALARSALVVRREFPIPRVANCQLEPRSALGEHGADGYTLVTGCQGPVLLRHMLTKVLGSEQVRVITRDVGGAFGPRTYLQPEQITVLWAAKRLGRPVRWTSSRSEAFLSDFQGRDATINAALGLDAEGRILGYDFHARGNIGGHTVSFVPLNNLRNILTTAYRIQTVSLRVQAVATNTVPAVPYRGAGRPEAHHAIERLLDLAARRLRLDRAEIRRRNLVTRRELPYRTPTQLVLDAVDFPTYMQRALDAADYAGFAARKKSARRPRGIGIANYVESPVGAPRERIELHVTREGVEIVAGTQSSGQGHETSFVQVAADLLQLPMDRIRLRTGDTGFVKAGGGSHSDRSLRFAGTLLVSASAKLLEAGRQAAAGKLEVRADDLMYEQGVFRVAGTDRAVALVDLAPLGAEDELNARIPATPGGCAVCEVEVDPDTGVVEVLRYVTVDDVGQAVNPAIVHGQTHGGIAQGVGQALMEGMVWDADKQVLTGSFMDYAFPRAEQLSRFDTALAEEPATNNPLRVKGGGEGGVVPATAAVINAVCDALGIEDIAMPATPHRVWQAMRK